MGVQAQANEIIHHSDVTAQQSQQAPSLLINSTRAAERWDGKSKVLKLLEPILNSVRNIIEPLANVVYGAMPATFRGLSSDVSTTKNTELDNDLDEGEVVKKPRQILVPQPRNIAQRKMTYIKNRQRPKKYTEIKISLESLKNNKDLHDYIKTKKYKYNYPNTNFYPRVKYFVNPTNFLKPNNSRLLPYNKESYNVLNATFTPLLNNDSEWRPIVFYNHTFPKNITKKYKRNLPRNYHKRQLSRSKRSINSHSSLSNENLKVHQNKSFQGTGRFLLDFLGVLLQNDPLSNLISQSINYTQTNIDNSLNSNAPGYYTIAYNMLMINLDFMEGLFGNSESKSKKSKKKRKQNSDTKYKSNCKEAEQKLKSHSKGL